jgi:pimeloyl-ACP methyl ester carboxylesterase
VRRRGIRVLILHGTADLLVPAANSRRLAALLPNAEVRREPAGWYCSVLQLQSPCFVRPY